MSVNLNPGRLFDSVNCKTSHAAEGIAGRLSPRCTKSHDKRMFFVTKVASTKSLDYRMLFATKVASTKSHDECMLFDTKVAALSRMPSACFLDTKVGCTKSHDELMFSRHQGHQHQVA